MKKLIYKTLVLLSLSTMIMSCNTDDNISNATEQNPYEKYAGNYKGTYSGGDIGEWEVSISNEGIILGTVHSTQYNLTFQLSGEIDLNGNMNAAYLYNNQMAGTFDATINGTSVTGTWINSISNLSGTLEGNKQ